MSTVQLKFDKKPANGMAMLKALILPRKGFDAAVGLPELTAQWSGASVDPIALQGFYATLELSPSDFLPITYPHVLAGSMHMNMLSHQSFPIRLLGALHLKNRIVQYRPIALSEVLDIDARWGDFRLVEKGVEFDLHTECRVAGELVWQETSIFFVRGRFGGKETPATVSSFELENVTATEPVHSWHIPSNRGRQYARISGDYNPIHMSAIAAKMFGFKRDIAHGFGVLAQAIGYSEKLNGQNNDKHAIQLDVIFKGPVFLGSDVRIEQNIEQSADRFDVYCEDNERPSLCVSIKSIAER
jgi:acyl dehydratase